MSTVAAEVQPMGVYLRSCLAPFEALLSRPDVTDVYVTVPEESGLKLSAEQSNATRMRPSAS
jgi:hypothetical protein